MKVLHVINGLGTGGAERSLAEMLPLLDRAGVDSTVVCLFRRAEGVERGVVDGGADVVFLASRRLVGRARELRRIIVDTNPDLVHATLFDATVVAALAAVGRPTTVLASLVNTTYDPVRRQDPDVRAWSLRLVQVIDSWVSRRLVGHMHAITEAVKEAAVRDLRVPPERVTVVERGRDPGRLGRPSAERRRAARRALDLDDGDRVVVAIGRQEFQKGHRHLLEAARELSRDHDRLVVLLAGRRGAATDDLERLHEELGLGTAVRFLGHRGDVPELLAAADVFAFPSLYEGLGCSAIEAMALGLPIVASDIPALRDVVEEGVNAVLVPPGEPAALAAALDGLLRDGDRAGAYGARSRQIFEERFTLERSVARMVELYERLAAGVAARRVPATAASPWPRPG